jgi:cytochrome c oxidase subunit 1
MVFLAIVPLAVGAFGNYVVPLQVGAPDMAFPKLNMMSYWLYLPGGLLMLTSFFLPGGAPNSGWTSYPPLSIIATQGQTIWIIGMIFLITSSLLGSINFIVTIFQLRAKGLTFMRSSSGRSSSPRSCSCWPSRRSRPRPSCSSWIASPARASSCPADS